MQLIVSSVDCKPSYHRTAKGAHKSCCNRLNVGPRGAVQIRGGVTITDEGTGVTIWAMVEPPINQKWSEGYLELLKAVVNRVEGIKPHE